MCELCGALARVSYLESTRAKAPHNSHKVVPFYSGAWTNFVPGLTVQAADPSGKLAACYIRLCDTPSEDRAHAFQDMVATNGGQIRRDGAKWIASLAGVMVVAQHVDDLHSYWFVEAKRSLREMDHPARLSARDWVRISAVVIPLLFTAAVVTLVAVN